MLQNGYRFLVLVGLGSACALIACDNDETTDDDGGSGGDPTTTTTSSTTVATSTSGAGGNPPITCEGGTAPTNIPEGDCNLLNQNCPAGTGCAPINGASTTGCVQGGLKEAGMGCANNNECMGGTSCVFGKCAAFCCPNNHQPCGGGFCNVNVDYGMGAYAYVCSYPTVCQLFEDNQCSANEDCHPMWNEGIATCVQPSSNPVGEGEPCQYINDCGDMQTCDKAVNGVCRYACDLANFASLDPGKGGCANASQTCTTFGQIPGVGLCQPM
jgi:hypothetical protein